MQKSPLLSFKSSAFPAIAGEDEQTNPGICGKALAEWLGVQLRAREFSTGDVIAEDLGWCVPVNSLPQPVFVACSSGDSPDAWQVFSFVEPTFFARFLGRGDGRTSLGSVSDAVQATLGADLEIRELRSTNDV